MNLLPTPNLHAWILRDIVAIEVQQSSIKLVVCFVYGYNRGSQTQTVTLHKELFVLPAIKAECYV